MIAPAAVGCKSLAAGEPAIDCFPTDAFPRAIDHVLTRDTQPRGVTDRPKGIRCRLAPGVSARVLLDHALAHGVAFVRPRFYADPAGESEMRLCF